MTIAGKAPRHRSRGFAKGQLESPFRRNDFPSRMLIDEKTFYLAVIPYATDEDDFMREADGANEVGTNPTKPAASVGNVTGEEVAQTGSWSIDSASKKLVWSDENYRIFGVARGAPLSYEAFLATLYEGDRQPIDHSWQVGPHGAITDTEREIVVNGKTKWVRERAKLEFDEEGRLISGHGTTLDITERKKAEQALAQSRARFESVVETAMDAIIAIDADHHIVLFNAAAEAMFHCPVNEAIGQYINKFIPERFRQTHAGHIRRFATSGTTNRAMGRLGALWALRADGGEFPIEASISQTETAEGKIFTVIIRDIADRFKAEESQRLLTAELDHRVKNTLATFNAVVQLSSRGAQSVGEFVKALGQRIHAMSTAHNLLQRVRWDGADLAELCESVLTPYRSQTGNIRLEGEQLNITPRTAQSLALAFNELATNAVKYGALSAPNGRVAISWWRSPKPSEPDDVRIVWHESGGPPVSKPPAMGFGLSVLQRMVAFELSANVTCDFQPQGLVWTIEGSFAQPPAPAQAGASHVAWLSRVDAQVIAKPLRVLIVEDDGPVAHQLKALLEGQGHTVVGLAANIKDAESLVANTQFDAALLDIKLSDGDCLTIAEMLAERKAPFAILSGSNTGLLTPALREVPKLVKPFADADVFAILARLCATPGADGTKPDYPVVNSTE